MQRKEALCARCYDIEAEGSGCHNCETERDLLEVARKLAAKRIGAVVVVGARGAVVGILSEHDIVRALSVQGPECLEQPVSEIMTREVITCQETDTLDEIMAIMTARRFRHLPVVADGALVRIISIGDVVKHHVAEAGSTLRIPQVNREQAGYRSVSHIGGMRRCNEIGAQPFCDTKEWRCPGKS